MQATAMQANFSAEKTSTSAKALWAGRIMSGFVVLFLLVDAGFKLLRPLPAPAVEAFGKLGYPVAFAGGIGILLLACVAVYLIPRTSVLGAILLENGHYNEAAERLHADDFSLDSHRRIFGRMADLIDAGRAVDIVTLVEELSIRTQRVQPLMKKLEQFSGRMDELERIVEELKGQRCCKEDRANLEKELHDLMRMTLEEPAGLRKRPCP